MSEPRPSLTGRTDLLGIIGDPVVQARTPALANAALAARGIDAVLAPLRVRAGALGAVVAGLRAIETFRGAVVTMPHKTAMMALLDDATPEARQVGACNVIRRTPEGRIVGTMLDGEGFVAGLRAAGHDVAGKRVYLAGAGGAAAGIAFALARHGAAALHVRNRTRAKADALVALVRDAWPRTDAAAIDAEPADHDLVVNATSLGIRDDDALPMGVAGIGPGTVAAEIVIRETPFLRAAAERGAAIHGGEAMLAAQIDLMLAFMLG
jgi:shikimate dehydrogenase